MDILRAYGSRAYWRHGFSVARAASALLSSFGALWLIVEIASYFSPSARTNIQSLWPAFLLAGALVAFWINKPQQKVQCKLVGRDITLIIGVGDLFKAEGALIIGTNRTFDTDLSSGLISKKSVQGQFSERYYDSTSHLASDISFALQGAMSQAASISKPGNQDEYPVGTVAKVSPKDRNAYLVAIAKFNERGVANGTFEDLKNALPALWEFIASAGSVEPLVMPVLGTGFSRLPETREEIIREIVNSFVAACSARRFTDSLKIVMHPRDFYRNSVDIVELGKYLEHVCKYTEYGLSLRPGRGTPA